IPGSLDRWMISQRRIGFGSRHLVQARDANMVDQAAEAARGESSAREAQQIQQRTFDELSRVEGRVIFGWKLRRQPCVAVANVAIEAHAQHAATKALAPLRAHAFIIEAALLSAAALVVGDLTVQTRD